MRIATVTVLVLFLAAAAGCAGNPTSSQAAQCESGLRVAYKELDFAKTSGFSGTVEYSKAAGLLTAFIGAAVFGWFCVRLSGVYFAMLTLAFAQIAWSIVFQWRGLTGGDDGLPGGDDALAALVRDVHPALQDHGDLHEVRALAGLDPAGGRDHAGDAHLRLIRIDSAGVFLDALRLVAGRFDDRRRFDDARHVSGSGFRFAQRRSARCAPRSRSCAGARPS